MAQFAAAVRIVKAKPQVSALKNRDSLTRDRSSTPNTTKNAYSVDSDLPISHPNRKKAVQLDAGT